MQVVKIGGLLENYAKSPIQPSACIHMLYKASVPVNDRIKRAFLAHRLLHWAEVFFAYSSTHARIAPTLSWRASILSYS